MNASKEELRESLLKRRRRMSGLERQQRSSKIADHLKTAIDWNSVSTVHIFESIEYLREVNTKPFIDYLKQNYPAIKLYHPRKANNSWHDMDENNNVADNVKFDVIIVPTLAFDDSLNRLGHGGGHYDKFLSTQKDTQTIGLCFEFGHQAYIPVEEFDVPLDYVISEKQVYTSR